MSVFTYKFKNNGDKGTIKTLEEILKEKNKEIERLKKCYCNRSDCAGRLNQKNEVYDSVVQRNERAIEYIEEHNDYFLLKREVKELLDILKGAELTENDKKQVKWLKEEFNVGDDKE